MLPRRDAQANAPLDVLGAVHDFLMAHIGIAPEAIIRGWQNRADLPPMSSYAVLTLINAPRRGTNVHVWEHDPAAADGLVENVRMLVCYEVQVDVCGQDEAVVGAQAARLVMLCRDAVAVDFFRALGLSCQYADDPRSLPFSNDVDQWEVRYSVTLHLSAWLGADIARAAFTDVDLRLEDVDVHHPASAGPDNQKKEIAS
ncbi:MAG: hypothetical protein HDR50_06870 [Desulfovibrio sp.]|uniref:phage neck terminator protein n=1 Tax=Desulfovibrio sp. TaxID=885 RepID=UPI001A687D08|nr:hypothetical protein [Desulfovibrio sp.]MBD5417370.1 hypothetical protein [Desulfovibrio sp.]